MMEEYHPKWSFLTYAIWGLVVAIASCFLTREAEIEVLPGEEEISHYSSELQSN
jgi:hypothetical protein